MHLIVRGLFITIVALLIALVGFLSFLASLRPQATATRKVEEISLDDYQAPSGFEGEKIISDSIREAKRKLQESAKEEDQALQNSDTAPLSKDIDATNKISGDEAENTDSQVTSASHNNEASNEVSQISREINEVLGTPTTPDPISDIVSSVEPQEEQEETAEPPKEITSP